MHGQSNQLFKNYESLILIYLKMNIVYVIKTNMNWMIYYKNKKKRKFINISIFKVACDRQTSSGLRDRLSDGRRRH